MTSSVNRSPSASEVTQESDNQTSTVISRTETDHEACPPKEKSRRRPGIILGVVAGLFLIGDAVVLGLTLGPDTATDTDTLKATFITRCKEFKGTNCTNTSLRDLQKEQKQGIEYNCKEVTEYDCEKLWDAFEQAYVGRDTCTVPKEAYDPFIAAADFKPACNRLMFWSKTKEVVHNFTKKRDYYLTVEDTVLGSMLNDLTWCGKEGSDETFTTNCTGWRDCESHTNAVGSFWNRVSAAFADAACGDVTVMLNGSIATPFNPTSIFATVEMKRFDPSRVESLNVVLVTEKSTVTNCTNTSLRDLQKELKQGIKYNCKEVTEAQIQGCSSKPEIPCGAFW